MKKLIILCIVSCALLASYTAKSQASFVGTTTNPTRAILNATADTANYTTNASYSVTTVQVKVTRATGTMAGKAYIWSSPDGVNYTVRDSLTLTNVATQYLEKDYTGGIRRYWRVIQNGGTTVTGTLNAKIWGAGQ